MAAAPSEWPTTPATRTPRAATASATAPSPRANSTSEDSRPSDSPWPAWSNTMAWKPASTSAGAKACHCAPRPPQPWLRITAGRSRGPNRQAARRVSPAGTTKPSPPARKARSRLRTSRRGGVRNSRTASATARSGAMTAPACRRARVASIFMERTIVLFMGSRAAGMEPPSGGISGARPRGGKESSRRAARWASTRRSKPASARAEARRVAEQALRVVVGEHEAEHLEDELARVGVGAQLAAVDGHPHGLGELAREVALALDHGLAHRAGLVVVLRGGGLHRAAAAQLARVPASTIQLLEQGAQPPAGPAAP